MSRSRTTEAERSREAYEVWHTHAESESASADQPWHRLVRQYLRPRDVSGRRLLEVGCGRGELACAIAAGEMGGQPAQLVGADFAHSAVRYAARRGGALPPPRPQFAVADIMRIPFPDGSFDTVISCETLEHVADPAAAVREIHRVLAPGGRFVLTVPNYTGVFGAYRIYLRLRGGRYTEGDQPICHFTTLPRTILWLRRAGFHLSTVDAAGHYRLRSGQIPAEARSPWRDRWLWPFGLHSVVVADKASR